MTPNRIVTSTLIAMLLSGCMTVGPDYRRPEIDTPEAWPDQRSGAPPPSQDITPSRGSASPMWWRGYNDPVLDAMIEEALAHNADLRLAIARLDEARATLGLARADQLPIVSADGHVSHNRISERSPTFFPGIAPSYKDQDVSLNASWEIDFWGKYRRATEAARAELLSAQFNRDAVQLTLIADVARGYFNLRSLDAQVAVARRTLSTRLASLALQRKRFEAGVASELELRQIEAETAAAQGLLPSLERQLAQQENALSVLLGLSPRAIVGSPPERGAAIEALTVPPAVPAGLPSDLLERRPDLREAEQRLIAANARIGVAKAAYYPSISLTGFFGSESATLADLFTSPARIWQYSASVAQTVFSGGRAGSQVEAAQARQQQALALYQSAIQNAFRDTLDALVAQRKARETLEAEQARVTALSSALELAQMRYDNGVASQLDLLDTERGLLDAELNRIEAQRAQLAATADLFKALGGGWIGGGGSQ
ncbi:MAG: efflux transporter outer membrane subunit [Nitrospirae bacterium]|nr:efflux transporter outer membrane subunit [Nitrospirota bacterium]